MTKTEAPPKGELRVRRSDRAALRQEIRDAVGDGSAVNRWHAHGWRNLLTGEWDSIRPE